MLRHRLLRRAKRRLLELAARRGYDIEKRPGARPPYRLLKRIPLGDDPLADVRRIHGGEIRCVFDVGAHVGQSAALFSDRFPAACIHSFEPDPVSFQALSELAADYPRVTPVHAAAGDRAGHLPFFVNVFSQTNSLLAPRPDAGRFLADAAGLDVRQRISVPVLTLDRYCEQQRIDRIDLLKLDTQGFELRVLDGAAGLLAREGVPLIYLEVGFVPLYEQQPLFPEVFQYLYARDYRLVWLYERSFHTHLFTIGANALFVHERTGSRLASPITAGRPAAPSVRAR
jgi:FkbM family methyltransferase